MAEHTTFICDGCGREVECDVRLRESWLYMNTWEIEATTNQHPNLLRTTGSKLLACNAECLGVAVKRKWQRVLDERESYKR